MAGTPFDIGQRVILADTVRPKRFANKRATVLEQRRSRLLVATEPDATRGAALLTVPGELLERCAGTAGIMLVVGLKDGNLTVTFPKGATIEDVGNAVAGQLGCQNGWAMGWLARLSNGQRGLASTPEDMQALIVTGERVVGIRFGQVAVVKPTDGELDARRETVTGHLKPGDRAWIDVGGTRHEIWACHGRAGRKVRVW
jgi:hypothetical protein